MRHCARFWVSLAVAACCWQAGAQTRIYSCVDAKGHRLTSDRPIMDCLDREQQQYGENGLPRGKLPPSLTADERAVQEAKAHEEEAARARQAELKRRDRVLLNRYPDAASHERERTASLAQVDDAIASGERRVADLQKQRADLEQPSQAAGKDAAKAGRLKRSMDENTEQLAAQNRLLASQREERQRIVLRFDDERSRLQAMWAQSQAPVSTQRHDLPITATAATPAKAAASQAR